MGFKVNKQGKVRTEVAASGSVWCLKTFCLKQLFRGESDPSHHLLASMVVWTGVKNKERLQTQHISEEGLLLLIRTKAPAVLCELVVRVWRSSQTDPWCLRVDLLGPKIRVPPNSSHIGSVKSWIFARTTSLLRGFFRTRLRQTTCRKKRWRKIGPNICSPVAWSTCKKKKWKLIRVQLLELRSNRCSGFHLQLCEAEGSSCCSRPAQQPTTWRQKNICLSICLIKCHSTNFTYIILEVVWTQSAQEPAKQILSSSNQNP